MIERSDGGAWIGRNEPCDADNAWHHEGLQEILGTAGSLWRHRWPEDASRWDAWNVAALYGPFGRWRRVDFHAFSGFGTSITPVLQVTLRWEVGWDRIDPVWPDQDDPGVLHRSHRLFEANKAPRVFNWHEHVLRAYKLFDRYGLPEHPLGQTRKGWEALLAREGLLVRAGKVEHEAPAWVAGAHMRVSTSGVPRFLPPVTVPSRSSRKESPRAASHR